MFPVRAASGRRACPALGESICAACCGTKRLVEISCPPECSYLRSSQAHPPAAVQRQRERDLRFLIPILDGMTERQNQLTLLIQGFLRGDRPDAPAMLDDDVGQAARALAETYETASRGIIYEHSAGIPSAERLGVELRTLIESSEPRDCTSPTRRWRRSCVESKPERVRPVPCSPGTKRPTLGC